MLEVRFLLVQEIIMWSILGCGWDRLNIKIKAAIKLSYKTWSFGLRIYTLFKSRMWFSAPWLIVPILKIWDLFSISWMNSWSQNPDLVDKFVNLYGWSAISDAPFSSNCQDASCTISAKWNLRLQSSLE